MLATIKSFFSQFIEPGVTASGGEDEAALHLATAALLLEMMRMDNAIKDEERQAVMATLRQEFGLEGAQLETLVALAEAEARQAHDYYQFTSLINQACDHGRKVRIIEKLWHVAMVDGHLDAHELHLMRRLGDLLHVGHGDFVAAKQRARVSAGLPPG
jgi:uncharacterized tellurite resistance protein B-like protein